MIYLTKDYGLGGGTESRGFSQFSRDLPTTDLAF